MFDTIILLTGPGEAPVLTAVLCKHNPQLTVRTAQTLTDLEAFDRALLRRARLIGFLTPVLVPPWILDALGFGAYNFHPGPPHYPGWLPSYFAVYDGATRFGATAHVMDERVDTGPIVGIDLFDMPPHVRVLELEQLALARVARLFWVLSTALATNADPLPHLPIGWSGRKRTRRQHVAMCDIPLDISREELQRRVNAFGECTLGIMPTITLHGQRFTLVKESGVTTAVSPPLAPIEQNVPEPVLGSVR